MSFTVRVDFNTSKTGKRLKGRLSGQAQSALDQQVLKDSNYYCPQDTSELINSSIRASAIGSGLLIWDTPYARPQYYGLPNKSTDKNPNARGKWFEAAKAVRKPEWLKAAQGGYDA